MATATASRIRYDSDLLGAVAQQWTRPAAHFTVLGQTVRIDSNTVFADTAGRPGNAAGRARLVEVYAVYDPAGQSYRRTRVEPAPPDRQQQPHLRGLVSQTDTGNQDPAHRRDTTYSYGSAPRRADRRGRPGSLCKLTVSGSIAGMRWRSLGDVQAFGTAVAAAPDDETEVAAVKAGASAAHRVRFCAAASASMGVPVDASNASLPER